MFGVVMGNSHFGFFIKSNLISNLHILSYKYLIFYYYL